MRLTDSYLRLSGPATTPWSQVLQRNGLANVRASYPLRPYAPQVRALEPLRLMRIRSSMRHAAMNQQIFHLWWHPHNFGAHTEENLSVLRQVLEDFDCLRRGEGMVSIGMAEAADAVRSGASIDERNAMRANNFGLS